MFLKEKYLNYSTVSKEQYFTQLVIKQTFCLIMCKNLCVIQTYDIL
jgi:hypothetical protein